MATTMTTETSNDDTSSKEEERIDQFKSRVDNAVQKFATANTITMVSLKEHIENLRKDPPTEEGSSAMKSADGVSQGSEEAKKLPILHDNHDGGNDDDDTKALPTTGEGLDVVTINASIMDPFGDRGDYQGEVLQTSWKHDRDNNDDAVIDAIPSGLGVMKYADGRTYKGRWKNSQWHGRGKATYPNGDSYEGMYHEDQRHGTGVYLWNDGRIFRGDFSNDQRNGHGLYQWLDGSKYEGEFQEGKRHGWGTYTFRDGSVYTGEWRSGSRHGRGQYKRADGRIYKGEWINGQAHGYGVETRSDGSVRHDGQWEDDLPIL
mmetsp:Transcript_9604/g.20795  ORF Transcript_9604/g.20795 Transcript_9604/m.20795 type:complete len:318 (-) Transcript_9604:1725-2678(-)